MFGFVWIVSIVLFFGSYANSYLTLDKQLPKLARIVAADNCLDDTVSYGGDTMYDGFINMLKEIDNDKVNFAIDPNNCINITYTSRDTAPQKGTRIEYSLTAYFTYHIALGPGFDVNYKMTVKDSVIGTKYYRDR